MSHILLVGCGKMGSAMLKRWQETNEHVIVFVSPSPKPELTTKGTQWISSPTEIADSFKPDIIVLAVKPQIMPHVLPSYARFANTPILSIAAGISLESIAQMLGSDQTPILRAMPNLPAQIGQGATALVANRFATARHKEWAQHLLSVTGLVRWLEREELMDAVTALSGSGPAYIFALVECMEEAGLKLGLPEQLAHDLAQQTLIGSAALLASSSASARSLREAVTSKGGTTEAALSKLMREEQGLSPLIYEAMQSAVQRARDLCRKVA